MARTYLLDTGPIFDYLLARFSEDERRPELLAEARFLSTPARLAIFKVFVAQHAPFITVAGVVVEVQHVLQRHRREAGLLKKSDHAPFWSLLRGEYLAAPVSEEFLRVDELHGDVLSRYGPVDSALVTLALRYLGQNRDVAVLTGDWGLVRRCRALQVPVEWIDDVLARMTASATS